MSPDRTMLNDPRILLAVLCLACQLPALAAEPRQAREPCSGSAFLATNYTWAGIPVMRNASQSAGDESRCLYVVPVSVELAESWHLKRLGEEGWEQLSREPIEKGVELEFRKTHQVIRVAITDLQLGTAVLLRRPVFITAQRESRLP
jgi:hypothetical protein